MQDAPNQVWEIVESLLLKSPEQHTRESGQMQNIEPLLEFDEEEGMIIFQTESKEGLVMALQVEPNNHVQWYNLALLIL